jgi:hypothetical protein
MHLGQFLEGGNDIRQAAYTVLERFGGVGDDGGIKIPLLSASLTPLMDSLLVYRKT